MTTFLLVRHGQTEGNRERLYRGRWDLPLDETGLEQVERAGRALSGLTVSAIYTSPLLRTRQTAAAVARHHGCEPRDSEGLLDIDYGSWTRQPDEVIRRQQPELYRSWREHPCQVVFPGGEGLAQVRQRASSLLQQLLRDHRKETVVLVGHRVSVKMLLLLALGLPDDDFWKIQVDPASISALSYQDGAYQLLFVNDTCHLYGMRQRLGGQDF